VAFWLSRWIVKGPGRSNGKTVFGIEDGVGHRHALGTAHDSFTSANGLMTADRSAVLKHSGLGVARPAMVSDPVTEAALGEGVLDPV
jgi:hypothetical protein